MVNVNMKRKPFVKSKTTLTEMKYGWSKYGGARYGLVRFESDWVCQACGETQPKELTSYLLSIDKYDREFVRICGKCRNEMLRLKIKDYFAICRVVRRKNYNLA